MSLKEELLDLVLKKQQAVVANAERAMKEAQSGANEESSGMEERFEGMREQLQNDRDMYAKQLEESLNIIKVLNRINPKQIIETVSLGSIVRSSFGNVFVSASQGNITTAEGEKFVAASLQAPVVVAMAGKKKGDSFTFRDKKFTIEDIY